LNLNLRVLLNVAEREKGLDFKKLLDEYSVLYRRKIYIDEAIP